MCVRVVGGPWVRGNVDPVALFAGEDFITDKIHDTIKKAGTRNHIMAGLGWWLPYLGSRNPPESARIRPSTESVRIQKRQPHPRLEVNLHRPTCASSSAALGVLRV